MGSPEQTDVAETTYVDEYRWMSPVSVNVRHEKVHPQYRELTKVQAVGAETLQALQLAHE